MNKRDRMTERIRMHGNDLKAIFDLSDADPIELCKKLRRLEVKANRAACVLCNGDGDIDGAERELESVEKSLVKIIGKDNADKVFINRDPRGYALKIRDEYVRENNIEIYRDWGGYGILAPDLSND